MILVLKKSYGMKTLRIIIHGISKKVINVETTSLGGNV